MRITEYLKDHLVFLDGAMGTMLQKQGLRPDEHTEMWNLTHPEKVRAVHEAYYNAGSNIVITNTFGANLLHFDAEQMDEIIKAGIGHAKAARDNSTGRQEKFVAFDIGPLGKILKPFGDTDFEDAVELFAGMVRCAVKYQPDLFLIETMSDSYETQAALLAVKENSDLPVFVSNAYEKSGRLMTGADPSVMVSILQGMGADAIGVNCSFGPDKLAPVVKEYLNYASVPILLKPNAGLPRIENEQTVYDIDPDEFTKIVVSLADAGVRIFGGCCGTTPEYIAAVHAALKDRTPVITTCDQRLYAASYSNSVPWEKNIEFIVDPEGPVDQDFIDAFADEDIFSVVDLCSDQADEDAEIVVLRADIDEIDSDLIPEVIREYQMLSSVPLLICVKSMDVAEKALRAYNGSLLVYAPELMQQEETEFKALVKKYGGILY